VIVQDILNDQFPDIEHNIHPKDRRMQILADRNVEGMGTENIHYLVNELIRRHFPKGTYLEFGTYRGLSLLAASIYNKELKATGIDMFIGFKEIDPNETRKKVKENINKFKDITGDVQFIEADWTQYIKTLKKKSIDVYYYDALHDFTSTYQGLKQIIPYLKDKCIILMDDINYLETWSAKEVFLGDYKECHKEYEFRREKLVHPIGSEEGYDVKWWNGYSVISRGFKHENNT